MSKLSMLDERISGVSENYFPQLSFVGTGEKLLEYLKFAEWCLEDVKTKFPGAKVEKIFDDFSGYSAQ